MRNIEEDEGELMTLEEFISSVRCGAFIDYDGFGEFATKTQVSDINVYPSIIDTISVPEWATHVLWYNR